MLIYSIIGIMAINYVYLSFLLEQIELFSLFEYIIFMLLFFYIIVLFFSIILIFILNRKKSSEKEKLLKYEKLLINLRSSYNNGQINAKQYRVRMTNLNNKYPL